MYDTVKLVWRFRLDVDFEPVAKEVGDCLQSQLELFQVVSCLGCAIHCEHFVLFKICIVIIFNMNEVWLEWKTFSSKLTESSFKPIPVIEEVYSIVPVKKNIFLNRKAKRD